MMAVQRGEHIQRFETTRIRKDGHPIDVSLNMSPVMGGGGMVVGASVVARDITEHKEAQSALLDLRALVEASDDAIIGTDLDGIILSWNKGAEKICGYKAEEILGRSVSVFVPPDRLHEHYQNVRRLRRGEHIQRFETTRIRKDGHPFDVSITISPVMGRDGIVLGASVVARDITEHKEAQSALLDLRALVEASDVVIIAETLDGTIINWNMGAEKMYGYKAEEILGKPISVLMPPGHPNDLPEIMKRLQRGEHIETFETTRIHKDGHPFDVSITISPVKGRGGAVVGAVVVARNITEQRQAREALRLSEERFRIALKNTPVVVFSQDLKLRFTWINSSRLLAPEELIGRTDAEVFPGEDGARLTAIKQEVLRTGIEAHTEVSVTVRGEKHYFDLVVEPLRDRGKLLGLLCSAIDTTFMKETILRLQEALNQVQVLSGLLPICASCKKIKDERARWQPFEGYIQARSEAKFTHGLCPDCMRELYPEYYRDGVMPR
jgi:PAS domain S-box-containing protein